MPRARSRHWRVQTAPPSTIVGSPPRNSSSGLTRRTSSSGTSENSSDTSRPTASTLQHRRPGQRQRLPAERRGHRLRNRRGARSPRAPTPSALPVSPSMQHLRHVGGEHLPGRRPDALEDRDAPDLLLDEHARDAPDADPAEHDDHETDEAQVILRPRHVFADVVFCRSVRPRVDEPVAELAAQRPGQWLDADGSTRRRIW